MNKLIKYSKGVGCTIYTYITCSNNTPMLKGKDDNERMDVGDGWNRFLTRNL